MPSSHRPGVDAAVRSRPLSEPGLTTLIVPQGTFELRRRPARPHDLLRAWDAADEYLLRHVGRATSDRAGTGNADRRPVLVVNDNWGALCTALAAARPDGAPAVTLLSDSVTAIGACADNLTRNGIDGLAVRPVHDLGIGRDVSGDAAARDDHSHGGYGLVVMRVPKSLSLLEHQLSAIRPTVGPDTLVVAGAMTRDVHTSTLALFDRILGPVHTSLAVRKARLILCSPRPDAGGARSPWPREMILPADATGVGERVVVNHAGVFSAERLDVGTRFMLAHLPRTTGAVKVIDLGCGNGILGLAVALANRQASIDFVDESYLAVESARATIERNLGTGSPMRFVAADSLARAGVEPGSTDLVINNPPFHLRSSTSDQVAWQMFRDARTALRTGGQLWVVGNRHLAYHAKLARLFGGCDLVASNAKFVVLRATKRRGATPRPDH